MIRTPESGMSGFGVNVTDLLDGNQQTMNIQRPSLQRKKSVVSTMPESPVRRIPLGPYRTG
jgi:hypothetical protein